MKSNDPDSEATDVNSVTSFDNNGFTLGNYDSVNKTGYNFAAWCWETSDTTVTNNDGEQTSQVRSNGNFSVVKYSSTGGPTNVGHGLGNVPAFYIIKRITNSSDWTVYHQSLGSGTALLLNSSNQADENAVYWNNTDPTDTTFNLGSAGGVSGPGNDYIAYCWAETPGVSSFGEYVGNSQAGTSGPVITCGFRPAFILIKNANASANWVIFDAATSNSTGSFSSYLEPDTARVEQSGSIYIRTQENGFNIDVADAFINKSGETFVYAAFAGSNPIEVIDVDVDNNQMTVDGGDWGVYNQSQEWSSNLSASGSGFKSGNPATNAFDGTGSNAVTNDANATLTFDMSSYSLAGPVEVKYGTGNSGEYSTTFVGSTGTETQTFTLPALQSGTWRGTVDVGTITSISVTTTSGSQMNLIGVKVADKLLIDTSITPPGETVVTGPPLIASANDVEYLDGNTLGVNGVSGTWFPGLHAQGAEVTQNAPSPESIQYTSANGTPLTTPFTGTDATLTTRTWTWQVSNAVTGPWSDLTTRIDSPGQDGAVPLADRPTLEPNKFYQVKVRYDSNNAEFVESTFNTFKTGDN